MLRRLLFALASAVIGGAIISLLVARYLLPTADITTGASIVMAALASAIVIVVLTFALFPSIPSRLRTALTPYIVIVALVILALIAQRTYHYRSEQAAYLQGERAKLPPFVLSMGLTTALDQSNIVSITFDSAGEGYEVDYRNDNRCVGQLPATHPAKVELLGAQRDLDLLATLSQQACLLVGNVQRDNWVDFSIREATPPHTQRNIGFTATCPQQLPQLRSALQRILSAHQSLLDTEQCESSPR